MAKSKSTEKLGLQSLKDYYTDGRIKIPNYQRDKVWTKYQKQLLIDSILRDIDIPKIYFDVKSDQNGIETYYVVDGQQRIGGIIEFFNDEFKTMQDSDQIMNQDISDKLKSELPTQLIRQNFETRQLDVVYLREYSKEDVKEMFVRLQEGAPLNAAEKRRALPGNVPSIIENISNHKIFTTENFLNFENKRFAFQDSSAKIFHQFVNGDIVSITPSKIKDSYGNHQTLTEENQHIKDIKKSMNFVHGSLSNESPKLKKYALLRLVFLVNDLLNEYNLSHFKNEFGKAWIDIELMRKKDAENPIDDQNPELVEYGNCARGDSVAGQGWLHNFIKKNIIKRIPELENKDPQRIFTNDQKWVIFQKSNKNCQADKQAPWYSSNHCKQNIRFDDFHADHIVPHSGNPPGKTSVKNGQALCQPCNLRKSNSQ